MLDYLPADANEQARLTPVYETLEGWSESTHGARSWAELPANAIKYVRRVEELIGAPVALLSTSPDRDDTIMVRDPFVRPLRSSHRLTQHRRRVESTSSPCRLAAADGGMA